MKIGDLYVNYYHADFLESSTLRNYFEEMALKGWHIKSIVPALIFKKGEPERRKYSVEYFDKMIFEDSNDTIDDSEYIDHCKQAGWDLVCKNDKIYLFTSDDIDAVPIETDERQKLRHIVRSKLIRALYELILLVFMILQIYMFLSPRSFGYGISNNIIIAASYICLVLGTKFIFSMLSMLIWIYKSRKKLNGSGCIWSYGKKYMSLRYIANLSFIFLNGIFLVCSAVTGIWEGWIAAVFLIPLLSTAFEIVMLRFDLKPFERAVDIVGNILICVCLVVFGIYCVAEKDSGGYRIVDDAPITFEDISIEYGSSYTKELRKSSSLFSSIEDYQISDENRQNLLGYKILKSDKEWVINKYVKDEKEFFGLFRIEPTEWNANDVYTYGENSRFEETIVVYDDAAYVFYGDFSLDSDEIEIIKEKLNII